MPGAFPVTRRARVVTAVLALVLVVGGCTNRQQAPSDYGGTTDKNFNEGCVTTLTSGDGEGEQLSDEDATDVCRCSYEDIVDEIPFEDFEQINEDQSADPGPLDERIAAIVDGCTAELR